MTKGIITDGLVKSATPALSERRQRFIIAYLETLNASEAARRAGYKTRSDVAGARLMVNDRIRAEISAQLNRIIGSEKDTIKHRVLVELQRDAFESEAFFEDESPKGGIIRRPNPVRTKALELLAKYVGILTEKVEVTGKDGAPIVYQVLPETARE